jgi:hypothetical protein
LRFGVFDRGYQGEQLVNTRRDLRLGETGSRLGGRVCLRRSIEDELSYAALSRHPRGHRDRASFRERLGQFTARQGQREPRVREGDGRVLVG